MFDSLRPVDCSLPGSPVHGILHSLEWIAIPFSRGSSQTRDQTWDSCIADRFFMTREAQPSPIEFNTFVTAKLRSSFRQINRPLLNLWGLVSRLQGPGLPGMEAHRQERLFLSSYWAAVCTMYGSGPLFIWIVFCKELTGWVVTNQGNQTSRVRRSGSQQMPGVEGRRRRLCIP